jgi:thiamine biosynthesis protein ThiS
MNTNKMSGTISIIVNGDARNIAAGLTVAKMLDVLAIHGGRVAIERNLQILPRAAWNETVVVDNDRYEIVQFVGGG